MFKVTEDLVYIGVDDEDIGLFEGQYSVPHGVSYNSYIYLDKKIAVFDTVDNRKTEQWLKNLENALGGAQPDYLVVSHVEPDHSASIPAFIKKYPQATLVGNEKTFALINAFYGVAAVEKLVVKEGDALDLGRHKITFVFAPMVHWPEVMMSYEATDKVLFSADAFGKFGTLAHGGEWLDEARRYYINIVGKYGLPVTNVLKKAGALDIKTICPLHGPVLSENLGYYLEKYSIWSAYRTEENGVLIAYASVYGNTASVAKELADTLNGLGIKAETADLNRSDISLAVANAFKYSALVLAGITYDGGMMPCMESFIGKIKSKNYCKRTVGFIQNGSWAPLFAGTARKALESCKELTFCTNTVTVNSAPDDKTKSLISELAKELAQKLHE